MCFFLIEPSKNDDLRGFNNPDMNKIYHILYIYIYIHIYTYNDVYIGGVMFEKPDGPSHQP